MILDALAERLRTASVCFPAVDLFIGILPDQPDRCVAIYEYAGAAPLEVMVDETATLERPSIQVLVRAGRNDYPTARMLAGSVQATLSAIANETIDGERFLRVHTLSSVNALGTDDNDRPMFSLALQAVVER